MYAMRHTLPLPDDRDPKMLAMRGLCVQTHVYSPQDENSLNQDLPVLSSWAQQWP